VAIFPAVRELFIQSKFVSAIGATMSDISDGKERFSAAKDGADKSVLAVLYDLSLGKEMNWIRFCKLQQSHIDRSLKSDFFFIQSITQI
jgi:hypothetical protein